VAFCRSAVMKSLILESSALSTLSWKPTPAARSPCRARCRDSSVCSCGPPPGPQRLDLVAAGPAGRSPDRTVLHAVRGRSWRWATGRRRRCSSARHRCARRRRAGQGYSSTPFLCTPVASQSGFVSRKFYALDRGDLLLPGRLVRFLIKVNALNPMISTATRPAPPNIRPGPS
jgi:hypothetical protein